MCLEREDVTLLTDSWYSEPYAHYTPAVVDPDCDVIEEWEFYWGLAQRMGTPIRLAGGELDLATKPTKFEVLEKILTRPRVPLAEIRTHAGGHVFDEITLTVQPAPPGWTGRLDVGPPDLIEELAAVRAEAFSTGAGYGANAGAFTHRLISRRLKHVYNSSGRDLSEIRKKGTTNPAYMHPDDLAKLGVESGELVEIASDHAAIVGVAEASDDVPHGVISMAHSWGDAPEHDARVREIGGATNRLVANDRDFDPISGMARQSAIPVNVRRLAEAR